MQSSEHDVKRVLEEISGVTNPFSSSGEINELYYLSLSVPAKHEIAKKLLGAQNIGRKPMETFIDSHLFDRYVGFLHPIKCNKLNTFAA